ncbi:hypothetical protein K469DRAFT_701730 [Zopfia rhizophila CBS 207.26]|uniref:Uncharacterized protein n=1 Tax=Zopfia rhizophila CBS 207.26 TaxID=1314779 RepID=A0A6A6EET6_9PEZI|nr:hypothetical protein K469DRAFT_701730 [Zopfia rhizophila CBS 207.26]
MSILSLVGCKFAFQSLTAASQPYRATQGCAIDRTPPLVLDSLLTKPRIWQDTTESAYNTLALSRF